MPTRVRCPCGKKYKVDDRLAGKTFQCKVCGEMLAVELPAGGHVSGQPVCADDGQSFLDMDLDAEYTRLRPLKVTPSDLEQPEPEFADPFEVRGLRAHGLDRSSTKEPQPVIPAMPRLENAITKLLPLLGVFLGLGMIGATYVLSVYYGFFWPFLGAAGIIVSIVFLNKLTSSEE